MYNLKKVNVWVFRCSEFRRSDPLLNKIAVKGYRVSLIVDSFQAGTISAIRPQVNMGEAGERVSAW